MQKNIFFLSAFVFLFLMGCGSLNKITGKEQEQLDQNLAGYTGVLLIERNSDAKGYNGIDKQIDKEFKKHYKGEFLLVKAKDIAEYSDLDKYRFHVIPGYHAYKSGDTWNHNTNFVINDRKTGKTTKTEWMHGHAAYTLYPPLFEKLRASK